MYESSFKDQIPSQGHWKYSGLGVSSFRDFFNHGVIGGTPIVAVTADTRVQWTGNRTTLGGSHADKGGTLIAFHAHGNADLVLEPSLRERDFLMLSVSKGCALVRSAQGDILLGAGRRIILGGENLRQISFNAGPDGVEFFLVFFVGRVGTEFLRQAEALGIQVKAMAEAPMPLAAGPDSILFDWVKILTAPQMEAAVPLCSRGLQHAVIEAFSRIIVELGLTPRIRPFEKPPSQLLPGYMRRAIAIIKEQGTDELEIGRLAKQAGVSARVLQIGFRSYFDMTPMAYVRLARLHMAREALTSSDVQLRPSVAEVARAFGFRHLGRFSKSYSLAFGETPSATLRRSKSP